MCASCSITNLFTPKATILKEPSAFRSNIKKGLEFDELAQNIRDFSGIFAFESAKSLDDKSTNNVVSPLSMYSALSVAAACSSGATKVQLLSALQTNEELLTNEFADIYSASNYLRSFDSDRKVVKKEELTNSIWIDKNVEFKSEMLNYIADKFFSYSVSVDWKKDNKKANRQMSKFVEEKTNGLISPKFEFNIDTMFTILNTLYLKSLWNSNSDELDTSDERFTFTNRDDSTKELELLVTKYQEGRILRTEKYSSFFAETCSGDRIKFIVPNDGVKLEDIVTSENISVINNELYKGFDEENNTMYFGKTYFPGFEGETKIDAKNILESMGIVDFFERGVCNFSGLTDSSVYCDEVQHVAKLKVDKKGIEGAAYTAIAMKGEMAPLEPEYKEVYEEFVVDKSFYFVVSDHNNLPLFSGIVNKI